MSVAADIDGAVGDGRSGKNRFAQVAFAGDGAALGARLHHLAEALFVEEKQMPAGGAEWPGS